VINDASKIKERVDLDFMADVLDVNITFAIHSKFPHFAVKQKIIMFLIFSSPKV
jgi:hypothetical protein